MSLGFTALKNRSGAVPAKPIAGTSKKPPEITAKKKRATLVRLARNSNPNRNTKTVKSLRAM